MRDIFMFLMFILLAAPGISLQALDTDRPLRSSQPETPFVSENSSLHIPDSSLYSSNALLTASNIEMALTQRYIAQYTNPSGIAYLNTVVQRANIYMPFIKEEVAKRNLPWELAYLPVIESSFVITARSRSGAMGLWQFMMNSISPFDMRVTDYIDERRDFVKSTKGALQKLLDNYRALGSWELSLAAYNSGLGAVRRTVQRTGINDYWELSARNELRQETTHFVPKFVAAVYVLSQPRRFGINVWHDKFEWEAIPLPRQISLDLLADEAGISRDLMRRLNAELLHGISPADSNYRLKIPASHSEQIAEVLQRDDLKLLRYHYHTVRHGDTLWSMSRHYGTSLNMIELHNPGISNRYLRIGETVVIPAYGDIAAPMPAITAAVPQNFNGTHVVTKGDTLWSLSRRFGVDPQVLAEANGMRLNQILHEGRTLKVPILE